MKILLALFVFICAGCNQDKPVNQKIGDQTFEEFQQENECKDGKCYVDSKQTTKPKFLLDINK